MQLFIRVVTFICAIIATFGQHDTRIKNTRRRSKYQDVQHEAPNKPKILRRDSSLSGDSRRSNHVWDIINTIDSYKNGRIFTSGGNDRPTLTSYHYLILPVWWSDESSTPIDVTNVNEALDGAIANHYNQSWGKLEITYEILPQQQIDQSKQNPRWYGTFLSAEKVIREKGYIKGQDYDGLIMVHNAATSGMFQYDGGG